MLRLRFGLVVCALSLVACQKIADVKEAALEKVVSFVPVTLDKELGERTFREMRITEARVADESLQSEINALAAPLITVAKTHLDLPYETHLTRDKTVNAFALPGGAIVLPVGLVLFAQSPAELQGVIAHELAHSIERHAIERSITGIGFMVILQIFLGDVSGLLQGIAYQAGELLFLKYSRDDEREADKTGFDLLVTSNHDTAGMASFFERLQQKDAESLSDTQQKIFTMLSTHPNSKERVESLKRLAAERSLGQPERPFDPLRFEKLQSRLKELRF